MCTDPWIVGPVVISTQRSENSETIDLEPVYDLRSRYAARFQSQDVMYPRCSFFFFHPSSSFFFYLLWIEPRSVLCLFTLANSKMVPGITPLPSCIELHCSHDALPSTSSGYIPTRSLSKKMRGRWLRVRSLCNGHAGSIPVSFNFLFR